MGFSSNGFDERKEYGRVGELKVMAYLNKLNIIYQDIAYQYLPFDIITDKLIIDVKSHRLYHMYFDIHSNQLESWFDFDTSLIKVLALVDSSPNIRVVKVDDLPNMQFNKTKSMIHIPTEKMALLSSML
jgi:hypothetical protein